MCPCSARVHSTSIESLVQRRLVQRHAYLHRLFHTHLPHRPVLDTEGPTLRCTDSVMVPSICGSPAEWEPQPREKEVAAGVSLGSLLQWPGGPRRGSVFRGGLGSSPPLVSPFPHSSCPLCAPPPSLSAPPCLLGKGPSPSSSAVLRSCPSAWQ